MFNYIPIAYERDREYIEVKRKVYTLKSRVYFCVPVTTSLEIFVSFASKLSFSDRSNQLVIEYSVVVTFLYLEKCINSLLILDLSS